MGLGEVILDGCIPLSKRHFFAMVKSLIQNHFTYLDDFHFALFNGAVSRLLVELPWTLKGQNGVKLDI